MGVCSDDRDIHIATAGGRRTSVAQIRNLRTTCTPADKMYAVLGQWLVHGGSAKFQ